MSSKKVTELQTMVTPAGVDKLYIVDDPNGTPTSKQINLDTFFARIPSNTHISGTFAVDQAATFTGSVLVAGDATVPTLYVERIVAPDDAFAGLVVSGVRPMVNVYDSDRLLLENDSGAYVIIDSDNDVIVTLPNSWLPGEGATIRRVGTGEVAWAFESGAQANLPASRSSHTHISEQHSEIIVRVLTNENESNAVYSIEGSTA